MGTTQVASDLPHTLAECAQALREGRTSSVGLTQAFLGRIAEMEPRLGAYARVDTEAALAQAQRCDDERERERVLEGQAPHGATFRLPAVHGVPIAVKDLFDEPGELCSAGSAAWRSRRGVCRSEALARLRAQGAVILGRTQMSEFAIGGTGINEALGTPRNPHDARAHRVPGGSSSGSAVAVAARLAAAALGSDTGGSVRIPAALNGIVGYKPTAGLISTEGCIPLSVTLDSVGVLAWTVDDAGLIARAAGAALPPERPMTLQGMRIAMVPPETYPAPCTAEVQAALGRARTLLHSVGAVIEVVDLGIEWQRLSEANGLICFHEAWQYHRGWIEASGDSVQALVRQRILSGSLLHDAEYRRLLAERSLAIERFGQRMAPYAALLMPTVGRVAPLLADADPADVELAAFTRPANYLGGCAISLPAARSRDGLPLAVQLVAPGHRDGPLLALARQLEALGLDAR